MPKKKEEQEKDLIDELLDEIYERRAKGERVGMAFLLEQLLNAIMERERQNFLKKLKENDEKDYANGFYQRSLNLSLGSLNLKIPRVRYSRSFRPAILPPRWKRVDKEYEEFLVALLANGYSTSQIQHIMRKLRIPFTKEALHEVRQLTQEKLDFFQSQPLKSDWFAIFIDAYHAKIRMENRKIEDLSLFIAVGIDLEGKKEILGFWIRRGRENKGFWIEVLQDLITRGVRRVLIFVTDDFRGISDVIQSLFPGAHHQLCLIHLKRNLRRRFSASSWKEVRHPFDRFLRARDIEEGRQEFARLIEILKAHRHVTLARELERKEEHYLAFLHYPEEVRRHIYTTNVVESLNAGIEHMRLDLGGYFPSKEALEVNLFVQLINHQDRWNLREAPGVRAAREHLHQIFVLRFQLDDETEVLHNF